MGMLNLLKSLVTGSTKQGTPDRASWASEEDEENEGETVYRYTVDGCQYVVQREWDDTWTWVKCDAESGAPLDMRCGLPSREEAQASAERDATGGNSPG